MMDTLRSLGMVEVASMSRGSLVADGMLKTAAVNLVLAQPVPPGKLLVAVEGDVADVEAAISSGIDIAGEKLVDAFFIPRLHPSLGKALLKPLGKMDVEAMGMMETQTVASAIRAADASLKAAHVEILSIRMGLGIGGKAIYYVCGSIADVQAAIDAGREAIRVEELFIDSAVIARPHEDFGKYLSTGPGKAAILPGMQAPYGEKN